MAALGRAATSDDALIWEHGRRLGIIGDGQSGDPSALILDGKVIASNRLAGGPYFVKAVTGVSPAGAVTLTGVQPGDSVVSVTDLSTPADASAKFETTISVANQIQQVTASTDVMLVCIFPRS
jgi:hypothetical protein